MRRLTITILLNVLALSPGFAKQSIPAHDSRIQTLGAKYVTRTNTGLRFQRHREDVLGVPAKELGINPDKARNASGELAGVIKSANKPNIIWVEADDLMPRFMNKLGDGFGLTPNLDRLATRGVHFPNAVCQAPMCGPSRNGLLTNLYSHNLGFYRNGHLPHPMELMDLVPTTFELAGVAEPNQAAKNGFSIVPLLEGKETNGRTYAFSEILGAQAATGPRYRYIVSEGLEILYDRETDPWEMKNVASEHPEVTERMRKAVTRWMASSGPVHPPKTY